jgi:hypothetical protein
LSYLTIPVIPARFMPYFGAGLCHTQMGVSRHKPSSENEKIKKEWSSRYYQ